MEAALASHLLLLQQQAHLLDALVEAGAAFVQPDAEARELVRQEGAREADLEPAAGDRVEHADLARELERVVEHGQHGASDQPRLAGALGGGGEKEHRIGAVAAIAMEIVLDDPHMAVAEPVAQPDQFEAFREILRAGLLPRPDIRKELHAEFHGRLLRRTPPARFALALP